MIAYLARATAVSIIEIIYQLLYLIYVLVWSLGSTKIKFYNNVPLVIIRVKNVKEALKMIAYSASMIKALIEL